MKEGRVNRLTEFLQDDGWRQWAEPAGFVFLLAVSWVLYRRMRQLMRSMRQLDERLDGHAAALDGVKRGLAGQDDTLCLLRGMMVDAGHLNRRVLQEVLQPPEPLPQEWQSRLDKPTIGRAAAGPKTLLNAPFEVHQVVPHSVWVLGNDAEPEGPKRQILMTAEKIRFLQDWNRIPGLGGRRSEDAPPPPVPVRICTYENIDQLMAEAASARLTEAAARSGPSSEPDACVPNRPPAG